MKTVIEMAREASDPEKVDPWDEQSGLCVLTQAELERFAELVRAAERNACMKEVDMLRSDFASLLRPPIVVAVGCFLLAYIVGFK
jgi:hypothetical protein